MGDSSPSNGSNGSLPGNGEKGFDPFLTAPSAGAVQPTGSVDLLAALRQNLEEGLQPPAAIMHAAAEAARILAQADGAALALRTHGRIVCRAHSGDPTPDLGAPLNTDSGISGECMRSATIMVCHDAASDTRVDPDVCRAMGISSIAVVPLRGPTGIAGILEVFSTHISAFGEPQIDSLRALAEIIEAAYGREVRGLQAKPAPPPKVARIGIVSTEVPIISSPAPSQSLARRFWMIGTTVVALLLGAGIWLGREPSLETSAKESSAAAHTPSVEVNVPVLATANQPKPDQLKPNPGVERTDHRSADRLSVDHSAVDVVKHAAAVETIEDRPEPLRVAPGQSFAAAAITTSAENPDPPPIPTGPSATGVSANGDQLSSLAAAPTSLPSLAAPVSQGITPGKLLSKVEPVYPQAAKMQGVAGTVVVEMTITEDGKVRNVKQISGVPILAQAASDAIRKWRYSPFLLNGKPLEVQKQISVVFKLPGS
jgi:TonB family protein